MCKILLYMTYYFDYQPCGIVLTIENNAIAQKASFLLLLIIAFLRIGGS